MCSQLALGTSLGSAQEQAHDYCVPTLGGVCRRENGVCKMRLRM